MAEFGYIERFLAEGIQHEDARGVREGEAKICFELGNFLFEGLVDHIIPAYIRINACLHSHDTLVTVCTIVFGVTLICV
jgi:hypothetical protein